MPLPNSEEAIEPVNSFSPPDEYAALLQRASEVSNIKILKEKYREAVSSRSPTKKHCRSSESPERKPAKVRRNYKFLPTRDDGKVEVPVILGRGVHRTILLEFGELCPLPSFRKGDFIFPVGFLSKRKYYTYDSNLGLEKPQKVYYFCKVSSADEAPLVRPLPITGLVYWFCFFSSSLALVSSLILMSSKLPRLMTLLNNLPWDPMKFLIVTKTWMHFGVDSRTNLTL